MVKVYIVHQFKYNFIEMRRTPYSQRNQPIKGSKLTHIRMPSDYISRTQKLDLNPIEGEGINLPKYRYQPHLSYRSKIPSMQRPVTTQRSYSYANPKGTSSQIEGQDNQSHINRFSSNKQSRDERRKVIAASLDEKKKQLWVSTLKQNSKRGTPTLRDSENSKGKIYRGSSWRPQQKIKSPFKGEQTSLTTRYSKINRNNNSFQESRVSTQKLNRHSQVNSYNGHIMDLIGRNLNKPIEQNDPNFFEYVMRFSYRTRKGFIPSNSGKVNQDVYIMTPNINGKTWQHFFAVCDGHGPLGHHVSGYIKNHLSNCVAAQKKLEKNPKQALQKAFSMAYSKLIKESKVDMSFSGSTVISCYLFQNKLFCCNVGDSRAIIGKNYSSRKWKAQALSNDHKPNVEQEANRIISMKGRVQAYKDEYGETIGPLRVWIQDDNIPGLAMTRSFGDLVGASVGVSPLPEILQFTLSEQDKILILASDGVFEFLDNDEIIQSLVPYYQKKDIQQASDYLLNKAHRSWLENSSIIDDITFIMIFLNYNELN